MLSCNMIKVSGFNSNLFYCMVRQKAEVRTNSKLMPIKAKGLVKLNLVLRIFGQTTISKAQLSFPTVPM